MAEQASPSQASVTVKRRRRWISALVLSMVGHALLLPSLLARLTEKIDPQLELTYLEPDGPVDNLF